MNVVSSKVRNTHLYVSHTPLCQSHFSMLVTLLYVSHTPLCQSHSSMSITLLYVFCQSHSSKLVRFLIKAWHQNDGHRAPRSSSICIFQLFQVSPTLDWVMDLTVIRGQTPDTWFRVSTRKELGSDLQLWPGKKRFLPPLSSHRAFVLCGLSPNINKLC